MMSNFLALLVVAVASAQDISSPTVDPLPGLSSFSPTDSKSPVNTDSTLESPTGNPTYMPTSSFPTNTPVSITPKPTNTPTISLEPTSPCLGKILKVDVLTDAYPNEISWDLINTCEEDIVLSSTFFASMYTDDFTQYSNEYCIEDTKYIFIIKDAYGDGICCLEGNGSYQVFYDGELVAEGGEFTTIEGSQTFGIESCDPSPPTTLLPPVYYQSFEEPISFPFDEVQPVTTAWNSVNIDNNDLIWEQSDEQSNTGMYSMKSPILETVDKVSASSNLTLVLEDNGVGALYFSVLAGNQMPYDLFQYAVDGVVQGVISDPSNEFEERVVQVGPGSHTFDFVYSFNPQNIPGQGFPPDGSAPNRSGAVFIDDVYFISALPTPTPKPTVNPQAQDIETVITCGSTLTDSTVDEEDGKWYRLAEVTGRVTLNTCGSDFDTMLDVYRELGNYYVGGNDDSCGLQSVVEIEAEEGVDYKVHVHGYGSSEGTYVLSVDCDKSTTSPTTTKSPTLTPTVSPTQCLGKKTLSLHLDSNELNEVSLELINNCTDMTVFSDTVTNDGYNSYDYCIDEEAQFTLSIKESSSNGGYRDYHMSYDGEFVTSFYNSGESDAFIDTSVTFGECQDDSLF